MPDINELFAMAEQAKKKAQELQENPEKRLEVYGVQYITLEELEILRAVDWHEDFIQAMDKLKHDDIVEFTLKMQQFKQGSSTTQQAANVPTCPTCGSTNVKKISGGKRWVTTGLFGLASSNLGKTMQCDSCGAKW